MDDLPWEDNLLERKTQSDLRDLLKTAVAFANSVRPGHVATILIGEKDDGSVQGVDDPDKIQKTVRDNCDKIYPPIVWRSKVYMKEEKTCVRVEIEFSGETPHFGDAAWVRRGSESVKATDEQFQRLIDVRSSKTRELTQWLNKEVTVFLNRDPGTSSRNYTLKAQRWSYNGTTATIRFINGFWVTLELSDRKVSEPLESVTLNWDDSHQRLTLLVEP